MKNVNPKPVNESDGAPPPLFDAADVPSSDIAPFVPAAAESLTPMMRQYRRMKSEIDGDVILMFRLGDFYELFFEDAVIAAPILGVTLTKRSGYPMCGVPYHAIDSYLAKLIRANRKIAICDQMDIPAAAKGIVRREVTRIVTPGTIT